MARKLRAENNKSSSSACLKKSKEYSTIAAQLEYSYRESIPFQSILKGDLTSDQKVSHLLSTFLESEDWHLWDISQQREFWKCVEAQKLPIPLKRQSNLGQDSKGKELGQYSPTEFYNYIRKEREVDLLRTESKRFKKQTFKKETDIETERNRRKLIFLLTGKKMGIYEGDPNWDDVIPIPQEDGQGALAAIAYTEEYSEAMSYLRAIMAAEEYSARVLELTAHIITLNPAHYTVWLYRASTIKFLNYSIPTELDWLNEIALQNQKNYQIWHHRQLLIDHMYPCIAKDLKAVEELAHSETNFMQKMLDEDSKNYHVWSYRQYLVQKLNLFNSTELSSVEMLLKRDVRNNSAWSHRFFLVFSNPEYTSATANSFEYDPKIPVDIIQREKVFTKTQVLEAPQNPSPWNYLRGILNKGGLKLSSEEDWIANFVILGEIGSAECKLIKSSHALEFIADIWSEKGEFTNADEALRLLGDKYDRIRKNYWEWRRTTLKAG